MSAGSAQRAARRSLAAWAHSLHRRGLTPGRSGNLSLRLSNGLLITPTGACLGDLRPSELTLVRDQANRAHSPGPSKELPLHEALYSAHPDVGAVVHLHSPYAAAVSCLRGLPADDVLAVLTPYYALRVGSLPLVDYHPPGSEELTRAVAARSGLSRCLLLRNHGSIAAAATLAEAVDAAEEIEASARLRLLTIGLEVEGLSPVEVAHLRAGRLR